MGKLHLKHFSNKASIKSAYSLGQVGCEVSYDSNNSIILFE